MAFYSRNWWYPDQSAVANQTVRVFLEDMSTYASIYSDSGLTIPMANPTTTNAAGHVEFYIADGTYWIFVGPEKTGDSEKFTLPVTGETHTYPSGDDRISITTGTGTSRWYNHAEPGVIVGAWVSAGVVPTGADIIIDVNKNGTTLFTTQANRPKVLAGTATGPLAVPDVTTLAVGDFITWDIDQIGSGAAGGQIVLGLVVRHVV